MGSKISVFLAMTLILVIIYFAFGYNNQIDETSENDKMGSLELIEVATEVVNELKSMDMKNLAKFINPDRGLIISPYSNVDINNANKFDEEEFLTLKDSADKKNWGSFDGSGEPIILTFSEYYNLFIFDLDFTKPDIIGVTKTVGFGNTINNLSEAFPNSESIEFHIKGVNPIYEGMDWRSLRLGFEKIDGKYYLVYIAHDQWTI